MPDQPDIVLVLTDQQRYDQVGYASGGHYETPNLDRLAAAGVVCDAAYSASTTCVPARVGLLTGMLHHRVATTSDGLGLQEDSWTVARALRAAGYQTALVGKAHFAPMRADHGFETLRLCEHLNTFGSAGPARPGGVAELDDYHDWLVAQGHDDWRLAGRDDTGSWRLASTAGARFPYEARLHPTAWVEQEALGVLAARDPARPLFLVVSFLHPHAPLNPPQPYASMYRTADAQLPNDGFEVNERLPAPFLDALSTSAGTFRVQRVGDTEQLRSRLTKVRALVKQLDDSLGRILEGVDLDHTLLWYTSDHGDYAGHRGVLAKFPWIPFDDLARVPLVVAGAGVAGGRRLRDPVQSFDFAPTALDVAGVPVDQHALDSRSLRPVLEDRGAAGGADRAVVCATGIMGWPMVRRGRWKYVRHAGSGAAALFDLDHDPGETTDRADDPGCRSTAGELSDLLDRALARPAPELGARGSGPASTAPVDERDLVFNIVFTPATFEWLRVFVLSVVEHSRVRVRLIANGCAPEEVAAMQRFRDAHESRIDVYELDTDTMVSHGRALDEAYAARPDGEWFCFADSDIKARGPWVDTFLDALPGCAALTSGALSWTTGHVAPPGTTSLAGPYLYAEDGFVFGSSYLAFYRRSAVDEARRRWGVGFENYGHAELPAPARRRIEELGRAFALYDTAKVLNILLQADGHAVRHVENPEMVHIGGMATEYLCQAAGVRREDVWLAWVQSQHSGDAPATPEDVRVSDDPRDRQDLASFPAVALQCLLRGEPPPALPQPLDADAEARLHAVVAELADLVERYD